MRRVIIIFTGALILGFAGCAHYEIPVPECPDGDRTAKFSNDIQAIFNQNCIACHSGSQAPDLSEGWSYDELIEGEYVNTEFPCESMLYLVFSGTHDGRASVEEVSKILGWIQEGAEDN